jgi:alpha-amylase
MTSASMATRFCVSEYFEGNPDSLAWWTHDSGMGGRSAVMDFTLHWALQAMCDDPGYNMSALSGAGYIRRDPFNAVTFVDNPDTDLSPGQQIISNKLLAYAFILTSEGYPFVYHKDYSEEPGCFKLKHWIDNLIWIHENLANGGTVTRYTDAKVFVFERTGGPGLLTAISTDGWNSRRVTCATGFGANVQLHDYTGRHGDIWTDGGGRATFTIPNNAYGLGQSYLCFSRGGHGGGFELVERATTQTFFGAADLDIPPCSVNGTISVGRVWCAAHKPIRATLHMPQGHGGGHVTLQLIAPDATTLNSQRYESHGTQAPLNAHAKTSGWHEFRLIGAQLPAPTAYELEVHYTATHTLHP